MKSALIVVDIQRDFLPGGALAVREGDRVIPVINAHMARHTLVFATVDYHPPGHESFASSHPGSSPGDRIELGGNDQVLWPDHCVQGTAGAQLSPDLDRRKLRGSVYKGRNPRIDSYSGFFDNDHRNATGLHSILRACGVENLLIGGLATDYCVRATVLDARKLGYRVTVDRRACAAVNLHPTDGHRAFEDMRAAGAALL